MNKNESKYFNTALLFDKALIYLLEKKDIEHITIKEICHRAGVNRSTFYLHYETIYDLVFETANYINGKFIKYFNNDSEDFVDNIKTLPLNELKLIEKSHLTPYLKFIKENKRIFKAAFNSPTGMRVNERYDNLKNIFLFLLWKGFKLLKKTKNI